MNLVTLIFASIAIVVQISIFIIESFLWLKPAIYERILNTLPMSADVSLPLQAKVLALPFMNQGYYNLFLALGGIAGIALYRAGKTDAGMALTAYFCLFATAAGLVFGLSSTVYFIGVIQGLPPFIAFVALVLSARLR